MPLARRHVVLVVALALKLADAFQEPTKFLLASDARSGTIAYMMLPKSGTFSGSEEMTPLIRGGGPLEHPQGLAVDQHRKRLLLADPTAKKVVAYPLSVSGTILTAGQMVTLADNVVARWVAVDGRGNVFYSDELGNQILKIPAKGGPPQVVYSGSAVSNPGGVGTDNFNLFWTNKAHGEQAGVLMTAPMMPSQAGAVALSKNLARSYGVCIALDEIYYTADRLAVFGMKKNGGAVTEIANSFGNPRGCAWDGDSTIYVADRGNGGIFHFSGPQAVLQQTRVDKTVNFENAFGVAVFSGCCGCSAKLALLLMLCSWQLVHSTSVALLVHGKN